MSKNPPSEYAATAAFLRLIGLPWASVLREPVGMLKDGRIHFGEVAANDESVTPGRA